MQLQRALVVVAGRLQGLGHDQAVNVPGGAGDVHGGKRRNHGWTKLSPVMCFGQDHVLARVEDHHRVAIIFSLPARVKVVRIVRATLGQNDHLVIIATTAAFDGPGQIGKVGHQLVDDGNCLAAGDDTPVKVKPVVPIEHLHVRNGQVHRTAFVGRGIEQCSANGHPPVQVMCTDHGVAASDDRVQVRIEG